LLLLSTITATLGVPAPLNPEMVPSRVAKMNVAALPGAISKVPAPYPLQTWPVGVPVLPLFADEDGTWTTSAFGTPAVLYSVLVPFVVLDTQNGLAGDADIPQVPTRFGSVLSATPAVSATRLC